MASINRRGFLFLGAGAAVANAFGGVNVYTSGIENEEVLKITHLEIDIGIKHAFKAFHFSDTHLNYFDAVDFAAVDQKKKDHYHKRWGRFPQALQSFYASVDYAMKRRMPMLHTGDLIDFTSDGNDRVLRHNVAGLDFHYAIGNHEYQDRGPEHYTDDQPGVRNRLRQYLPNDLTVASRVLGGANFVSFDNAFHNLREETIAGVKKEFEKGIPVVLMCHIPPTYTKLFRENSRKNRMKTYLAMGGKPVSIDEFELPGNPADKHDEKTKAFYDWLRGRKDLKAILCGHTHWAQSDYFSDTAKMYVAGGNFEGQANEIVFK
ncbi:MAG: metallophosphoesterase [Kiritimatiellae bacterium]|nr:metallophosphoesterase [Kiritimatiellia bacterium]